MTTHEDQAVMLPSGRISILTVYVDHPVPGPGAWVIHYKGWRRVEHVGDNRWRYISSR